MLGKFESLRILLAGVINSISDVSYLIIIMCLFLFMFATLGKTLFSENWGKWNKLEGSDGQWTFGKNFFWSVVTVFIIITGDAWNTIMVEACDVTSHAASIYFVLCILCGAYLVLNLFVAILLSRMGGEGHSKWTREWAQDAARKQREQGIEEIKALKSLTHELKNRRHQREFLKTLRDR
eukprot:UN31062